MPETSPEITKFRVADRSSSGRWLEAAIHSETPHAERKQTTSQYENNFCQLRRDQYILHYVAWEEE